MAPPELIDDLIGEILLRLPPEDPECLVRASLVCKPWRRLLSDPGFPRRHGVPPLLGFFHYELDQKKYGGSQFFPGFVPVKEASPIRNPPPEPRCNVLDCRHGRVLLLNCKNVLFVWDPITNSRREFGWPKLEFYDRYRAAVLCAVDGCDHLGCSGGPFLVVLLVINFPDEYGGDGATARSYSSETGAWSTGVSSLDVGLAPHDREMIGTSLLAGGALYFALEEGRRILRCELPGCGLSVMSAPPLPAVGNMVLVKAEGGGLGACGLDGGSLRLWAWRTGPGGIWGWEQGRVIQLDDIGDLSTELYVFDFAEGEGFIFLRANNGVFAVELKSGRARKIGEGGKLEYIYPFMSFYTPGTSLMPTDLFPESLFSNIDSDCCLIIFASVSDTMIASTLMESWY